MKKRSEGGYVALMSVIIIGLILLTFVSTEAMTGWYARYNVLGTEAKEQSGSLAEGCADQALSSIVVDPSYTGNATTTVLIDGTIGTCYIAPISQTTLPNGHTLVTIQAQAQVRGSYANLQISKELQSIHVGTGPTSAPLAYITVVTQVTNDNGGIKTASDFVDNVIAQSPSVSSFNGSAGGVLVSVAPGAFAVTQTAMSGYTSSYSGTCSGTAVVGQSYVCSITNNDVPPPTVTVNVTVKNNNGKSKLPADFQIKIDGVNAAQGVPITVSAGTHTLTGVDAATLASWGYGAGSWGTHCTSGGSIALTTGNNKTCSITYDDIPPVALACADTVIMMDRTGSVFGGTAPTRAIDKEAAALKNFLGPTAFGNPAIPASYVGLGSMGGYPTGPASMHPSGGLTTTYGTQTTLMNAASYLTPVNFTGADVTWTSTTSAAISDDAYAAAAIGNSQQTRYLQTSNMGLSVPSGAYIQGIEVLIERKASESGEISDYRVQLVKSGSVTGANKANSAEWDDTDATITYGSPTDLWGTTWTASDVNNTNFGIAFAAEHDSGGGADTAYVDSIRVRVYYSTGLIAAIDQLSSSQSSFGTGSQINQMINAGQTALAASDPTRSNVLILITDGQPNGAITEDVLDAADAAKAAGTNIFTMFYGTDPSGVNGQELMAAIASGTVAVSTSDHTHNGGSHRTGSADDQANSSAGYTAENSDGDNFYIAPTASDMTEVFNKLGQSVCPQAFGIDTTSAPLTATLNLITQVNGGTKTAADFAITLTAVNPSMTNPITGGVSPGTAVEVESGTYSVEVAPVSGYTTTLGVNCSGTAAGGDILSCTVTADYTPPASAPPPPTISTGSWVEVPN